MQNPTKRLRRFTVFLVASLTLAMIGAAPVAGEDNPMSPPGTGDQFNARELIPPGPDRPPATPADPILDGQVLKSFTADRLSVAKGTPIKFQWSVSGPADGVTLRLDGVPVPRPSGLLFVAIYDLNERHVLTAHRGSAQRELGAIIVGVNPCAPGSQPVPQCQREGAAVADYARRRQQLAYNAADLSDPSPASARLLHLDACATNAGRHGRVERYTWAFRDQRFGSTGPATVHSTETCESTVHLHEGDYSATMTARTADGTLLTTKLPVKVKDLFVVSIGDSYASGEGNPDVNGEYNWFGVRLPGQSPAKWQNEPCHRSALAGHSMAAAELSKTDHHTGLSFLSLACTGAMIKNVTSEPLGSAQPQLSVLRRTLREWGRRPIDLLIVSAGGNDIFFGEVAEDCVVNTRPFRSCDATLRKAEAAVGSVRSGIRSIQKAIDDSGLEVKRTLLVEYPANVFDGPGPCSTYSERLGRLGERLNTELRNAVRDLSNQNWHMVEGVTAAFAGQSYCDNGMFRHLGDSLKNQGDTKGTAHPNQAGQKAIARRVVETYRQVMDNERLAPQVARRT